MRKRISVALATVALVAGGSLGPARAADLWYVSGPGGGQGANYTVPVILMRPGDTVTYANIDIARHDVVALEFGPDDPWCAEAGFTEGLCPLFWTPLLGLAGMSEIYGLENVVAGGQHPYKCSIHTWMTGTLIVLPY